MVAGQRHAHHAVLLGRADRQDAGLGRVDDGGEVLDAVGPAARRAVRTGTIALPIVSFIFIPQMAGGINCPAPGDLAPDNLPLLHF